MSGRRAFLNKLAAKKMIIVDANVWGKKKAGERIIKKILEQCSHVLVNQKLLDEYKKTIAEQGMSESTYIINRLGRLSEMGKIQRVNDEELAKFAQENEEDAHIVNLAKTYDALVISEDKYILDTLSEKYNFPAVNFKKFIDS